MYYAEGYDFEVGYVRDVGPGTMSLRFLATNYLEDATDNGTEVIDRAGENIRGTPDWLYRGTARYDWNDWTFNLTMRGHSDGVMDNDFIECAPGTCPAWKSPAFTINENDVDWHRHGTTCIPTVQKRTRRTCACRPNSCITTIHRSHTHRCDLAHTPRLRLSAPAQEPGAAPDPKGSFMPEGWRWMLTPLTG